MKFFQFFLVVGLMAACSRGTLIYDENGAIIRGKGKLKCTKPPKNYSHEIKLAVHSTFDSLTNREEAVLDVSLGNAIVKLASYSSQGLDRDLLLYRICEISLNRGLSSEQTERLVEKAMGLWTVETRSSEELIKDISILQKSIDNPSETSHKELVNSIKQLDMRVQRLEEDAKRTLSSEQAKILQAGKKALKEYISPDISTPNVSMFFVRIVVPAKGWAIRITEGSYWADSENVIFKNPYNETPSIEGHFELIGKSSFTQFDSLLVFSSKSLEANLLGKFPLTSESGLSYKGELGKETELFIYNPTRNEYILSLRFLFGS